MKPEIFINQAAADRYYLELAFSQRKFSEDPKAVLSARSAVGVVIADATGVLSASSNILPPALKKAYEKLGRDVVENERYFIIEHAERAAIYKAALQQKSLATATMYCSRFPCSDCARAIIWAGIKRAIFNSDYVGEDARWIDSQRAADEMLKLSGVKVDYLNIQELNE
jgi:dCMP deaminase